MDLTVKLSTAISPFTCDSSPLHDPHNLQRQAVPTFIRYLRCYKELDPRKIITQQAESPGKQLSLCLIIQIQQKGRAMPEPLLKL